MVPSPPCYHKLLVPHHPIPTTHRDDPVPSTSASHPSPLATFHIRTEPLGQSGPAPDASKSPTPFSCHGGSGIYLVLFGAGLDQPEELGRAFGTEVLAGIKVLQQQDAAIALSDPRVSGAIICSPPDEAPEMVRDALRAGKGVFCEGLPSLDRKTAETCFDEADRHFDPALQFLYKKFTRFGTRVQKILRKGLSSQECQ
ncbi:hypothetical protein Nmel_015820 [Mimus melanotis]